MDRKLRWIILGILVGLFCVSGPLLVFYAMGYRFRLGYEEGKTTIRFEERGLILLESTPSGATVSIDGSLTKLKTPTSIYRPAPSECTISLQLEGHQPWSRTFQVAPQTVSRAEKIILSPTKIEAQAVAPISVNCFALSTDGKLLALGGGVGEPYVRVKDTSTNDDPIIISPYPVQHSLQPKLLIQKIEFAVGNRAALLTVMVANSIEQKFWCSLREPYELVKLDEIFAGGELFRINPRAPHQVFVVSGGQLHRVDVKEKTVKKGISRDVEVIEVGEDGLWLIKQDSPFVYTRPFNSNDPSDDKEVLEIAAHSKGAQPAHRRLVVDGSRNVAVLTSVGALLRDDTKKLATAFQGTRMIAFSPDHRWVALADADSVQIVEAFPIRSALFERSTEPQREMLQPYRVEGGASISHIFWWDDSSHLLVRRGKILELIEAEAPKGGNRHVLLDNLPEDSPLAFDPKEAVVYFTQRSETSSEGMMLYSARLRAPAKGMLDWLIKPKPPAPSATLSAP